MHARYMRHLLHLMSLMIVIQEQRTRLHFQAAYLALAAVMAAASGPEAGTRFPGRVHMQWLGDSLSLTG